MTFTTGPRKMISQSTKRKVSMVFSNGGKLVQTNFIYWLLSLEAAMKLFAAKINSDTDIWPETDLESIDGK
jgi:hypothetical protein